MGPVTIRPAVRDDIDAIVERWMELVTEQQAYGTALLAEENRETARRWTAELVASDGMIVASRDDELIGFVSFDRQYDRFQRTVTTGVVHNLVVREGDRSAGIGTDLLAAAEAELTERDVDRIRLESMAKNEQAERFYRERGYRIHRQTFTKHVSETDNHNTGDDQA